MTMQPNIHPSSTQDYRIEEIQFMINRLRLTAETRTWLDLRLATDRLEMPRHSTRRGLRRRTETTDVYFLAT